jgi:PhnB protein
MSKVSTYLNLARNTEQAFVYYRSVFGGDFAGQGIMRFKDVPPAEGMPLPEADKNLIMHIELAITGGHLLMGTDAPGSMGFNINVGNNVHIMLDMDTRAETNNLFEALATGGKITQPLQDQFWGAYYGSCTDKFGIQWMFNCNEKVK